MIDLKLAQGVIANYPINPKIMKILFCGASSSAQFSKLKELLPEHEIMTFSRDTVAERLDGIDVIIPSDATIDYTVIEKGQFGLINRFRLVAGVQCDRLAAAEWIWELQLLRDTPSHRPTPKVIPAAAKPKST